MHDVPRRVACIAELLNTLAVVGVPKAHDVWKGAASVAERRRCFEALIAEWLTLHRGSRDVFSTALRRQLKPLTAALAGIRRDDEFLTPQIAGLARPCLAAAGIPEPAGGWENFEPPEE